MQGNVEHTEHDGEQAGHLDHTRGYLPPRPEGRVVSITPGTIWLIFGILATMGIVAYIFARATYIFVLLFIAIIFAEAIRPIMNWLRRYNIPRPAGVLLIYVAILAVLGFFGWLFTTPLIGQIANLQRRFPTYMRIAAAYLARIQAMLGNNPEVAQALTQLEGQLGNLATDILRSLVAIPLAILFVLGGAIAVASMAFFWLTGTDLLEPFVVGLFPVDAQPRIRAVFVDIGYRLSGYVHGIVINMFAIGILTGVGMFLLGVPYAVLLGILAGLLEALPYVGPWIAGFVAVVVALISGGPVKAIEVVILFTLIQQVEGNTLVPLVMHRVVHLNPLTVIVAVLAGGALYGIVGAILAVPVAAVLQVVVERVLAPAARSAASHLSTNASEPHPLHGDNGTRSGAQGDTTVPTA